MMGKSIKQQVLVSGAHEYRKHFDDFLHQLLLHNAETFTISQGIEYIAMIWV
jgi:hypothetical protein